MKTPDRTMNGAKQLTPSEKAPCVEVTARSPTSGIIQKVPPHWAWHYRTLTHLRDRVQQAHAEHASQAATPPNAESNNIADTAQERSDRDLLWAELGAENDQLFEIDCALQRIHDGIYGFCEVTGQPIPPERLRAVPWTRHCRAAAAASESRAARSK
jgi:RNA polymerase-binding transcription factor DksA